MLHACSHDCSSIVFLTASTSTPEGWPRASTMIPTGASLVWAVVKGAIRAMHITAVHQLDHAMVNPLPLFILALIVKFFVKKIESFGHIIFPPLQLGGSPGRRLRVCRVLHLDSPKLTTKNPRSGDTLRAVICICNHHRSQLTSRCTWMHTHDVWPHTPQTSRLHVHVPLLISCMRHVASGRPSDTCTGALN
jgi:hypothetical protein